MAALVNPSSSAIICSDVPAKLCRVNRSIATSISRVLVSVVSNAPEPTEFAIASLSSPPEFQLYDRMVRYLPFVKPASLRSTRSQRSIAAMRDTEKHFFRDDELVSDPCLYLAAPRNRCPVRREPPTSESPRT